MSLPRTVGEYSAATQYNTEEENEDGQGMEVDYQSPEESLYRENFFPDLKSILANWILRIKESCKLTQATTEEIVQRVIDLNQYILSQVSSAVMAAIAKAGVNISTIPELHDIFNPNGHFGRPFQGLETSYQLLQYCKANLGFVVSTTTCSS